MKQSLVIAFLFFFGASVTLAQVNSNNFSISVFGGADTIPPTTPTLLSVTPIASTQININWSSSTDNTAVGGYSLSRDGIPIATTTLLNYSDTGLMASTTYSYTVRAFDAFSNYSSSSNSISTTTLETPVAPLEDLGTQEGTAARVVLKDFFIETGESTSSLNIKTVRPSRLEIRWGKSTSYELGYIVGSVFRSDHIFSLSDLEPNTTYLFEIVGYTPRGIETVLKTGSFATKGDFPTIPLSNVSRFQAVGNEDDVELSWQNPIVDDLSHVRIVRSYLGFPTHPADGAVVYQGLKMKVTDENILSVYSPVYYTAFVYDKFGNVSSGAVTIVYSSADNDGQSSFGNIPVLIKEATSSIDYERFTAEMKMPQSSDISVVQLGNKYSMIDSPIRLSGQHEFVIFIPVETVAGNLKSIILTILDPTDNRKAYSYLARINNNRTAYVATVPSLNVIGESQIRVEIFDYEAFVVGTYQTPLQFITDTGTKVTSTGLGSIEWGIIYTILLGILILCLLSLIIFLIYRRRTEDNKQ